MALIIVWLTCKRHSCLLDSDKHLSVSAIRFGTTDDVWSRGIWL